MYKLINQTTNQEYICEKVVVDGFEYYEETSKRFHVGVFYVIENSVLVKYTYNLENNDKSFKKVIATNNPSIELPQIVDEVEEMAKKEYTSSYHFKLTRETYIKGYNKAKEQYTNTKQDMIEFAEWIINNDYVYNNTTNLRCKYNCVYDGKLVFINEALTSDELIELFEQSRPKIIYFK